MGKTPPDALKTVDTTRIPPEGTWHTMFAPEIYRQRRDRLYREMADGVLVLLGHAESPINFAANPYPLRPS